MRYCAYCSCSGAPKCSVAQVAHCLGRMQHGPAAVVLRLDAGYCLQLLACCGVPATSQALPKPESRSSTAELWTKRARRCLPNIAACVKAGTQTRLAAGCAVWRDTDASIHWYASKCKQQTPCVALGFAAGQQLVRASTGDLPYFCLWCRWGVADLLRKTWWLQQHTGCAPGLTQVRDCKAH
jgi:hypothetical protein